MVTVKSIEIEQIIDETPDLSYLENPEVQGEEYFPDNQKRLREYGNSWYMIGIRARATVTHPTGHGGQRLEWLTSSGLWGIESDSNKDHLVGVAREELEDLRDHLDHFCILTTPVDWERLTAEAIASIE